MPDRWQDIHSQRLTYDPPTHRLSVPFVVHPTCEDHCRRHGQEHETDSVIQCQSCQRILYRIVLHEWVHEPGHYFHEVVPMNGAPPITRATPQCCGSQTVRR
jgi:hypothetical protein